MIQSVKWGKNAFPPFFDMPPNIFQGIWNAEERCQSEVPYAVPSKRHFHMLGMSAGYHFFRESDDTELCPIPNWLPQDVEYPDLTASGNLTYYLPNDCIATRVERGLGVGVLHPLWCFSARTARSL